MQSRQGRVWFIIIASSTVVAVTPYVCAQTPEENLRQCFIRALDKYQPISDYSQEFQCDVDNKTDPFNSPPSKGPYPVTIREAGFVFLDATAVQTRKVSDGGHTEPYISPRRDEVSSTLWCRAEDRMYGAGGHYQVKIYGRRQRVATAIEQRRALQECSKQVNVFEPHLTK